MKDKDDKTEETTFSGEKGEGYEIQQAWDKQAGNMSALSRSMKTLMSMIKEYDELLHKNWDTASEIQKAQLAQIQAQTDKLKADSNDIPDESIQNKMDAITGIVDQMQPLGDDDV